MRFIDNDEIPSSRDHILKPLAVIAGNLFLAPATTGIDRLYRVDCGDDLVMHAPKVLALIHGADLAERSEASGENEREILTKVSLHFRLPLQDQTCGSDNKNPANKSSYLQPPENQPRLDRLAKPNLVRKQ